MVVTTIIRRQSSSASLKSRLNWLIAFRLIISILAMAAILVLEARVAAIPTKYVSSYYTLIVACGVNIIYFFLVRLGSDTGGKGIVNLRWLAIIQILGDIMIESLLVYFTGIDRVFAYLYFATIASAAILISPVASYFFTSLAVVALSGVSLAYFFSNNKGYFTIEGLRNSLRII